MNFISSSIYCRQGCSLLAKNKSLNKFGKVFMTQMQNQKDEAKGNLNPNLTELKVGKFEKLLLVWGGKYKKMEDVPNLVNQSVLEKARNKARVKISIGMIVATLIGCIIMVISGKRAAERGETISKINADFRRELAEKANKE